MVVAVARSSLTVEADLALVIDGHRATLTGSGGRLRLEADAPAALWAAMNSASLPAGLGRLSGPRAIGNVADQLAGQGLEFSVVGPSGELVRLGRNSSSRIGRLATGSSAVRFGSVRAVVPVLGALARQAGARLIDRLRRR